MNVIVRNEATRTEFKAVRGILLSLLTAAKHCGKNRAPWLASSPWNSRGPPKGMHGGLEAWKEGICSLKKYIF